MQIAHPKYPNSAGRLLAALSAVNANQSYAQQFARLFFDEELDTSTATSAIQQ